MKQAMSWLIATSILVSAACGHGEEAPVDAGKPAAEAEESEQGPGQGNEANKPEDKPIVQEVYRLELLDDLELDLAALKELNVRFLEDKKVRDAFAAGDKFITEARELVKVLEQLEPGTVDYTIQATRWKGKASTFLGPLSVLAGRLDKGDETSALILSILDKVETMRKL